MYPIDLAFSPVSPLILGGDVSDALSPAGPPRRRGRGDPAVSGRRHHGPRLAVGGARPAARRGAGRRRAHAGGGARDAGLLRAAPQRRGSAQRRRGQRHAGDRRRLRRGRAPRPPLRPCLDRYGPCSDSKVVDAQFGYERSINALLGLAPKPRLLSGIGEIQAGVASRLEVLVIDDEVLNNVRYALAPRPWDADALDVEAMVDGVLSGRGFLGRRTRAATSAASS